MKSKLAVGGLILGATWEAYRQLSRPNPIRGSYADAPTKILIVGGGFGGLAAAREWMRSLGERLDGRTVEGLIIVNAFCTFQKQFEYPGDILAKLYVSDPGRTSFESWTTMTRADEPDAVYASGGSTIVWVDYTKQKSVPLPDRIRAIVQ